MYLRYQEQGCDLTLRRGSAEHHAYLEAIGRKAMVDQASSRLILEHDATHVIFGMGRSLYQVSGLDTWLIFGCQYRWRYLRVYAQLPETKALHKALIRHGDWLLLIKFYWKCLGLTWRIIRRTLRMTHKRPFQFSEEWLDQSGVTLRARHSISALAPERRATGDLLQWSGQH